MGGWNIGERQVNDKILSNTKNACFIRVDGLLARDNARELIESWREEYNNTRPHSSLNNLAPMQFVEYLRTLGVG